MPHLVLEYSANISEKSNFKALFAKCHQLLVEQLPTELASCKSRAIQQSDFYLGDGNTHNAFVHLQIKVLPGRTTEKLHNIGNNILPLLKDHFAHSLQTLNLQISLEIQDLSANYFKLAAL